MACVDELLKNKRQQRMATNWKVQQKMGEKTSDDEQYQYGSEEQQETNGLEEVVPVFNLSVQIVQQVIEDTLLVNDKYACLSLTVFHKSAAQSAVTDDGVDAETSLSLSLHLYLSSLPLHFILTLTFGQ